jgi:membrane fusion protein (multidrug efflux system)
MENNTEKTTTENAAAEPKKGKGRLKIFIGIAAVILIVGVIYFVMGANYETTDNAQLDADIVPIKSSVSGYIKTIEFEDNQVVKKGQLLFTIDDTELRTRVAQAEAALENAKANLISVRSNARATSQSADAAVLSTATTEQNISVAKARLTKAQEDFKRMKNMLAAKAATQSEYDNAKAELDVAQAQYNANVSQSKSSSVQSLGVRSQAAAQSAMISLAEALVKQREAELILAQTQLEYATVEAPCDGIVSRRSVEVGQYITIGQPLCSQIDKSSLWITANFKETQVDNIKPGQPVEIEIDAYPSMKLHGKVQSYIGATGAKFSLLPPDNSTGNFVKIVQRVPVKISIADLPKDQAALLFPGLSAFVSVKVK